MNFTHSLILKYLVYKEKSLLSIKKEIPMKNLFFTILVFFLMFSNMQAEEVWKITSLDWQPYSGGDLTNQGNSIQKLREELKKENIRLLVEFYPWKRAQNIAINKDYVGYFPAWPEEVSDGFEESIAIDWSEIALMTKSDFNVEYTSIDELCSKYKFAIITTYVYPKEINDAVKKYSSNVVEAQDEMSLLKMLSKDRFSIAITDPNVMLYHAGKAGISGIKEYKVLQKKKLVLALRRGKNTEKRAKLLRKLFRK